MSNEIEYVGSKWWSNSGPHFVTDGPIFVELSGLDKPLLAGSPTEVECRTAGSRPTATILWEPARLFKTLGPPVSIL